MRERSYTINGEEPLHARPAAAILKIAKAHGCELFIKTGEVWEPAGIMNLLLLKASPGASITLGVQGGREVDCLEKLNKLFKVA